MSSLQSGAAQRRKRTPRVGTPIIFHTHCSSRFGDIGIVWYDAAGGARIHRIFLPSEHRSMIGIIRAQGVEGARRSCRYIDDLLRQIRELCSGHAVTFRLDRFDLDRCLPFQRKVLWAEFHIPRGRVSTYGRIARYIGHPGAARAVGSALGANPYPLVIPCHRAIRETGELGGYRGGLAMKRTLLELEGIEFSASGRVISEKLYY